MIVEMNKLARKNNNENRSISSITNDQVYKIQRLKLFLVTIIKIDKNEQDKESTVNEIEKLLVTW